MIHAHYNFFTHRTLTRPPVGIVTTSWVVRRCRSGAALSCAGTCSATSSIHPPSMCSRCWSTGMFFWHLMQVPRRLSSNFSITCETGRSWLMWIVCVSGQQGQGRGSCVCVCFTQLHRQVVQHISPQVNWSGLTNTSRHITQWMSACENGELSGRWYSTTSSVAGWEGGAIVLIFLINKSLGFGRPWVDFFFLGHPTFTLLELWKCWHVWNWIHV